MASSSLFRSLLFPRESFNSAMNQARSVDTCHHSTPQTLEEAKVANASLYYVVSAAAIRLGGLLSPPGSRATQDFLHLRATLSVISGGSRRVRFHVRDHHAHGAHPRGVSSPVN